MSLDDVQARIAMLDACDHQEIDGIGWKSHMFVYHRETGKMDDFTTPCYVMLDPKTNISGDSYVIVDDYLCRVDKSDWAALKVRKL